MENDAALAIQQHLSKPRPWSDACACMGPRNGDPVCPCRMGWVERVNGRWWKITEHRSPNGVTHSAALMEETHG